MITSIMKYKAKKAVKTSAKIAKTAILVIGIPIIAVAFIVDNVDRVWNGE